MKPSKSPFNWRKIPESRLFFPIAALALILLFDLIFIPNFFYITFQQGHLYGSLIDILRNSTVVIALSIGMTLVIATGGVDLSVGAIMAIVSSMAAILMNPYFLGKVVVDISKFSNDPTYSYYPFWVVIVVPLVVATVCGLWNGTLVAYGKIQPMVATLILMIAGRGIAQLITNSQKIQIFYAPFTYIGNGWLLLPFSVFVVIFLFIFAWLLTRKTAIGMFIESVGINARSSFYSGINEKKIKLFAYMFCGFCAGIAGLIGTSNISTSDATSLGLNLELDAILAVVIGGTLLGTGGRFSLLASVIGALVMQAITTSMYAIGVSANSILAVKGVVVIVIILLYAQQIQDLIRKITGQTKQKETES
jgi:ribose/xylose/arabinose/galactoside ABC-type transport system permease subunit